MTTYEQPPLLDVVNPPRVAPPAPARPMTKAQRRAAIKSLNNQLRQWRNCIGLHDGEALNPGTEEGDHVTAYRRARQAEIQQQINDLMGAEA